MSLALDVLVIALISIGATVALFAPRASAVPVMVCGSRRRRNR